MSWKERHLIPTQMLDFDLEFGGRKIRHANGGQENQRR